MPPTFTPNIQWTLLKILDQILINLRLRGYHPLRPCTFQYKFNFSNKDP